MAVVMVSVISAILFIISCCKRLVAVKSDLQLYFSPPPSTPSFTPHLHFNVTGALMSYIEGPPGSLLYPLRYGKKRDPRDNVGSTQPRLDGSCLLWVMSTEISVDIAVDMAVDIAVDSRSIVGRQSVDTRSIVGRQSVDSRSMVGR